MAGKAEFSGGFKDEAFVTAGGFADNEKVRDPGSGIAGLLFQITPDRAFRVRDDRRNALWNAVNNKVGLRDFKSDNAIEPFPV